MSSEHSGNIAATSKKPLQNQALRDRGGRGSASASRRGKRKRGRNRGKKEEEEERVGVCLSGISARIA